MATQNNQDYFRSVSSESTTYMMVPANSRGRDSPSKLWIAMVVIVVVVLQIASTTGLFVYLNMSLSQVRQSYLSCTDSFLVAQAVTLVSFVPLFLGITGAFGANGEFKTQCTA